MPRLDHFHLTPEEIQLLKERRRRRILLIVAIALLVVLAVFSARPARDAIKGWQARRHATKAFASIQQENWPKAREQAVAAYQLRPTEPQALRAIARFLSRTRQAQALEFWDLLRKRAPLTREDLRDEAAAALAAHQTARAENAIAPLLKDGATPADWILGAQLALQKNAPDESQALLQKLLDFPAATEREQLQAAILALTSPAGADARERRDAAWARLQKLATSTSAAGLDALVVLTQQALAQRASSEPASDAATTGDGKPQFDLEALARGLEQHPLAKAPQKLLALDLLARADPSQSDSLIERGVDAWKDSDAAGLAALATWLNGKREFQRTLDTIPLEKTLESAELFLQRMDALGALSRWDEIKKLLEAERFPLDPMVQLMYLARCNAQLGETVASENNWQRALEAANHEPAKLGMLAEYAEKNGASAIAGLAFDEAAAVAPKARAMHAGRLRAAQRTGDAQQIHRVLAAMIEQWPDDPAIRNDEAYTRLLTTPADQQATVAPQVEEIATALLQANPASLPHRTLLALARLKQGRAAEALQVYADVAPSDNAVSPSAVAVHAAVLAANGQTEAASSEAAQLKPEQLLPEERPLIGDLHN